MMFKTAKSKSLAVLSSLVPPLNRVLGSEPEKKLDKKRVPY